MSRFSDFFRDWMAEGAPPSTDDLPPRAGRAAYDAVNFVALVHHSERPMETLNEFRRDRGNSARQMLGMETLAPASHLLVIGPSQGTPGKTNAVLVPQVLAAPAAVVSFSTKTDVVDATAVARSHVSAHLCHYSPTAEPLSGLIDFRPDFLDGCENYDVAKARMGTLIDAANPELAQNARSGGEGARHFFENMKIPLPCLAQFARLEGGGFSLVLELVFSGDMSEFQAAVKWLQERKQEETAADLAGFCRIGERERTSILTTLRATLRPFRTERMQYILDNPNARIADLVRSDATVYVTAPAPIQQRNRVLFALLLEMAIEERMTYADDLKRRRSYYPPLYLVLDELANCPAPSLAARLADCAPHIMVTAAVQSPQQFQRAWGKDDADSWPDLFQSVLVLPGLRHRETLEMLSKLAGTYLREVWSGSEGYNDKSQVWNQSMNYQREDVLPPDTISNRRGDDRSGLLLTPNGGWRWAQVARYFSDGFWPNLLVGALETCTVPGLPVPELMRYGPEDLMRAWGNDLVHRYQAAVEAYRARSDEAAA